MRWEVKTRPEPENPTKDGKNESGIVVYLRDTKSSQKAEVARVLFIRRNAMNKSVGFKRQLLKELDKAYEAAEVLNDTYLSAEEKARLKDEAVEAADEKRRKFLAKVQGKATPRV